LIEATKKGHKDPRNLLTPVAFLAF